LLKLKQFPDISH